MKLIVMRFWDWILTTIILLVGIILVYGYFLNENLHDEVLSFYFINQSLGALLGIIIIISFILRIIIKLTEHKDGFIDFESNDGSVGISTKALRDYIDRVAYEFAAVKHVNTKIISRRNGLNFILKLKIKAGSNIPELSQIMQQRVRESVRDSLGIEEVENIAINVQEIVNQENESKENIEELSDIS